MFFKCLVWGQFIWGIADTRALFGQPSFTSKIKAWLGSFPLLRPDVTIKADIVESSGAVDFSDADIIYGARPRTLPLRLVSKPLRRIYLLSMNVSIRLRIA